MRQHIVYPIVMFTGRRKPVSYAADCDASITAVDGNAQFPGAAAAVAAAKAALAPYQKAIDDVDDKVPGATKVRDDLKTPLKRAMAQLVAAVQAQVDKQTDQAATLAAAAKMRLRKVPVRHQQELTITDGLLSGQVVLVAKAIEGAVVYYWEYSTDGTNWLRAPDTAQAHTIISGLTPGQKYGFRVHALTRKGPTSPSQVKWIIVR